MICFTKIWNYNLRYIILPILFSSFFLFNAYSQQDNSYSVNYPKDYFRNGGSIVSFNPSIHRKIGVLIRNKTDQQLSEITSIIFNISPFDRYREFFYFRLGDEFQDDLARNNWESTRAYDYRGKQITGGLPMSEGRGAFNLIFLRFGRDEVIQCSCKGVTIQTNRGNFAYVGEDSILHEIGHAFAGLADEYSHPAASSSPAVNLEDRRNTSILKWNDLVNHGFLPNGRFKREEIANGRDQGKFLIPSNNCYMNNHARPKDNRFCPVCQLAIISRISELAGVSLFNEQF